MSLENLRDPATLATEIVEDLEAAMAEFSAIAGSLAPPNVEGSST